MQDFTLMRPLVDKLCESLITEPENWDFGIWYITSPNHLGSIEIYMGTQNTFTETRSKKVQHIQKLYFRMNKEN